MSKRLRLALVTWSCVLLGSCGAIANSNTPCTIVANVIPASATADHGLPPPGNQAQFTAKSSVTGNCPLAPDKIGTWATSDTANTTISNQAGSEGLATCLHATPTPASITYSGILRGRVGFTPATLTCK